VRLRDERPGRQPAAQVGPDPAHRHRRTGFDQTFFPDVIRRSISVDGGYAWDVTAKNHSPESEPTPYERFSDRQPDAAAGGAGGGRRRAAAAGLVSSLRPGQLPREGRLQPEDVETGWLPIETALAGAGWGIYFGPPWATSPRCCSSRATPRWAGRRLPAQRRGPAAERASGEILLKHKAGAFVRFTNDGKVHIEAAAGIESVGPWTHQGTLHVTDEVTADKSVTATVDVVGGGKHLKTHTHGGVQAGGGTSGPPT
jgi:hypothetical protein